MLVVLTNTNSSMAVTTVPRKNVMEAEESSIIHQLEHDNQHNKARESTKCGLRRVEHFLQEVVCAVRGTRSSRCGHRRHPRLAEIYGRLIGSDRAWLARVERLRRLLERRGRNPASGRRRLAVPFGRPTDRPSRVHPLLLRH